MSMKMSKHRIAILLFAILIAGVIVAGWKVLFTQGATYTWDNGGGDSNWSTCTNWTTDTCPGASDIVQFDGTVSDTPAIIDAGFTGSVAGVDILASYTSTITQSRSLTVGSDNFVMNNGTFTGGSDDIDINNNFTLSGGTFTSTSGTLFIYQNFTQAAGSTFNNNGGTLTIDGGISVIDVNGSITLNNLTFAHDFGSSCISNSDSDTLLVTGTFTSTRGAFCNTLTVEAQGPVVVNSTAEGGAGFLNITGGTGDINMTGTSALPNTTVSVARTINASSTSASFIYGLSLSNGADFVGTAQDLYLYGSLALAGTGTTFTAPSGTLLLGGFSGADVLTMDADATFSHNSGLVEMGRSVDLSVDVASTIVFNDLTLTPSSGRTISVASGDTMTVNGTLVLDEGLFDGPGQILAQGPITHLSSYGSCLSSFGDAGDGTIVVNSAITLDLAFDGNSKACFPSLTINNAGATVNVTTASTQTAHFSGDIAITNGIFNAGVGITQLENDQSISLSTAGTFNHNNGVVKFNDGIQAISGTKAFTFYKLIVASDTWTLPTNVTTVVEENLIAVGTNASGISTIASDTPGVQAILDNPPGSKTQTASVNATDQNWLSPNECNFLCTTGGNTSNWTYNQSVSVTAPSGNPPTVTEGDATTIDIDFVLSHRPTDDVTISVSAADPNIFVNTTNMVFSPTDWSTPQSVSVSANDDSLNDELVSTTIDIDSITSTDSAYSTLTPPSITVAAQDNDIDPGAIEFNIPTSYNAESTSVAVNGTSGSLSEDDYVGTTANPTIEDGGDIIYDSVNDSLWYAGNSANIYEYEIATDTLNSYPTGGSQNGLYVGHDSARNRFWMTVENDDEVIAFNDDGSIFTTVPLTPSVYSGAAVPNRVLFSDLNDATASNDAIWVGGENGSGVPSITKINAATGAYYDTDLATSTYEVSDMVSTSAFSGNRVEALAYDPTDQAIWVTYRDEAFDQALIKIDEATGAPYYGTFSNSTVYSPTFVGNYTNMQYDSFNDYVWVQGHNYIVAFDANDSTIEQVIDTNTQNVSNQVNTGFALDTTNNEAFISTAQGDIFRYDILTQRFLDSYSTSDGAGAMAFDGQNDPWVIHASMITGELTVGTSLLTEIRTEYPANAYLTLTTGAGSAVDSSTATDLTGVVVTETLNGQTISYALSFDDGATWKVWGSWRDIASNLASVHGGVNGTWYYRDNASTWTPASANNAETAISEAVAAGANNQMSGTTLNSLTEADLELTGGWSPSVNNIYFASTFYTTDSTVTPTVDDITFTFTGGGGPTPPTPESGGAEILTVSNISISSASCTSSTNLDVRLQGSNISDYIISESPTFVGSSWQSFNPQTEQIVTGEDGELIHESTITSTLSAADGSKIIYLRFRSSTQNQTGTFSFATTLDQTESCANIPENNVIGEEIDNPFLNNELVEGCLGIQRPAITNSERAQYLTGISPTTGTAYPSNLIFPGDTIRDFTLATVYCITEDLVRRPYVDEVTYFTHSRSFDDVKWVDIETLGSFDLGDNMLPRANVALVKFRDDAGVYFFQSDPLDENKGILRLLATEEIAEALAGPNWNLYVIDLNEELRSLFIFGDPFTSIEDLEAENFDLSDFRRRTLLNQESAAEEDIGFESRIRQTINAASEALMKFLKRIF